MYNGNLNLSQGSQMYVDFLKGIKYLNNYLRVYECCLG